MNLIIWMIVIILTSGSIWFLRANSKKREQKLLTPLYNFATENGSTLTTYDHWNNFMIGMENSGVDRLFFIRKSGDKETKKMVNLSDISKCRVAKIDRNISEGKESYYITDRIQLVLTPSEKNKPEIGLEFFNTEFDQLTISDELKLAEKWNGMITECISNRK